jgi:hypothetical protein
MLSMLCHFHGLLFARQCWMNRYATQRNAPHPPRNAYRERLSLSALAMMNSFRFSSAFTKNCLCASVKSARNALVFGYRLAHVRWHRKIVYIDLPKVKL